jgi:hypothetical protein
MHWYFQEWLSEGHGDDMIEGSWPAIGDQILARRAALVSGTYQSYDVANSYVIVLGNEYFDASAACHELCIVTVVSIVSTARMNLDHLFVVAPSGCIVRIFEDFNNGFWLPVDSNARARAASCGRWNIRSTGTGCMSRMSW